MTRAFPLFEQFTSPSQVSDQRGDTLAECWVEVTDADGEDRDEILMLRSPL